jgi:hypothetical protein
MVACPVIAPGGWLLVMGGEFGRLGRCQQFLSHAAILHLPPDFVHGIDCRDLPGFPDHRLSSITIMSDSKKLLYF